MLKQRITSSTGGGQGKNEQGAAALPASGTSDFLEQLREAGARGQLPPVTLR